MKPPRYLSSFILCTTLLLNGCGHVAQETHPPQDKVSFAGKFVAIDNPDVTLTVLDGRFRQGGETIFMSGHYHAHRIDDVTYELHVTYEGRFEGVTETLTFRQEGQDYLIGDPEAGELTKFKRLE